MARERNDSPNIKAVIFDYGLVLVRSPKTEEFGRMAQIFNVGFKLFYQLWESSRDLYDRGDISAEEYWLRLAAKTKTSIDPAQSSFCAKWKLKSGPTPTLRCSIGCAGFKRRESRLACCPTCLWIWRHMFGQTVIGSRPLISKLSLLKSE